ncbi:MAG: DUF308 domain-containing protein [Ruminococcus sp.]|nr:DUF308 domain-containing protein [Ruminococcus sp.]
MKKRLAFALSSAALSLISAVMILTNPFTTTAILWKFIAISLVVSAIFDIVTLFVGKRKQ